MPPAAYPASAHATTRSGGAGREHPEVRLPNALECLAALWVVRAVTGTTVDAAVSLARNIIERMDPIFLNHCRNSYENLLLGQPHVITKGLWMAGERCYIVCPEVGTAKAADGTPIRTWFHKHARIMCTPIELVADAPPSATPVPNRTVAELAAAQGSAVTLPDLCFDLSLVSPKTLPPFSVRDDAPTGALTIVTERILTDEEQADFRRACRNVSLPSELSFAVTEQGQRRATFKRTIPGDLNLLSSNALPSALSSNVRWLIEEDEERWVRDRSRIFTGQTTSPREVLPPEFSGPRSRCLVDATAFPPPNLRALLPLFRETLIALPLADSYEPALKSMCVREADLVSLAEAERVRFLLPQPVDRYPTALLNTISECAPKSLLFSHTLAAATVAESRRRAPFLYPPLDVAERSHALRLMQASLNEREPRSRLLAEAVLRALQGIWNRSEEWIGRRGATATAQFGAGQLIAAALQAATGRDRCLEISHASGYVEWAAALDATVFPVETAGYSEQATAELCASAYSGVDQREPKVNFGAVDVVLQGILGIDNDAGIADICTAFQGTDIDRLRRAVYGIAESNLDPEFLASAISEFNARVAAFERRREKQLSHDFVALASALAVPALRGKPPAAFLPLGAWLVNQLLTKLPGGRIVDAIRGATTWSRPDVVLVSRLKSRLRQQR